MKEIDTRDIDLAYCAGLIDGEGCITFLKTAHMPRRDGIRGTQYTARLHVGMREEAALLKLRDVLGGRINIAKDGKAFMYRWFAVDVSDTLRKLIPYLVVKKSQALIALEATSTQKSMNANRQKKLRRDSNERSYSNDERATLDSYVAVLKRMKRENFKFLT
ncbi:MAG: LAGLIDADG family homing endonuclease [Nitrososphaera sp.]|nr:LAGLIDADG family homing endonuclease [Nitrososphaera sp.]